MKSFVDIIGVPIDFGANKRGVDMGPATIRYTGLYDAIVELGHECCDLGNIEVPIINHTSAKFPQELNKTYRNMAETVGRSIREGHLR